MDSEVCVSVLCAAYNHEKYIRDALEGFVMQQTNFKFEVLINDDASTDGTAGVIREYEQKYPDIIKPVYQTENQYSQGISPVRNILFPMAKGRYIALCEGDDYWIDPLKLQKQFDYMESHPDCTFCFTNGLMGSDENNIPTRIFIPCADINKKIWKRFRHMEDFQFGELLDLGFIPTASYFFHRRNYAVPRLSKKTFQGDQYLKLYLTSLGYAHFINDQTCFYRVNTTSSVSKLWFVNKESEIKYRERFIALYEELDELTSRQYTNVLSKEIRRKRFGIALIQRDFKEIRSPKYWSIVFEVGIAYTLRYYLKCLLSFLPWGNTMIAGLQKLRKTLRSFLFQENTAK